MANIVFNVAKGRVVEFVNRVKNNDPGTSRILVVPIETTGLEGDAALIDSLSLAEVLDGATNEQTTMGRKPLTDSDLGAFPGPDVGNDRYDVSLPTVIWTAATGNPISKLVVAYDPNSSADSAIIPLCMFDFAITPDGSDVQMTGGVFYRAS